LNDLFRALPKKAQKQLKTCPAEGHGVHQWIFRTAGLLHRCSLKPAENEALLGQYASRTDAREIADAVRNSDPNGSARKQYAANPGPRWPARNYDWITDVIRKGPTVAQLKERSAVRLVDSDPPRADEIVDWLFPGDPLLCCGASESVFTTKLKSEWRGQLANLQFIVPNPIVARVGRTQSGKASAHAKQNTGPRQYLVIEFDFEPTDTPVFQVLNELKLTSLDACAALLWELGKALRLDLVVHSGGKSLHGWFDCHEIPEEKLHEFMQIAVQLGADPVTWNRTQFVRMPDGFRKAPPNRQSVCFVCWNLKS